MSRRVWVIAAPVGVLVLTFLILLGLSTVKSSSARADPTSAKAGTPATAASAETHAKAAAPR